MSIVVEDAPNVEQPTEEVQVEVQATEEAVEKEIEINKKIEENDKIYNNESTVTKSKAKISGAITTGEGSRRESNFVIGDFRYDEGFRWRENCNSPTLTKKSNEV